VGASTFSWLAYLRVDISREELFGEKSQILRWVRFFESRLRPSGGVELDIALPADVSIEDPKVLGIVARLADAIDEVPNTGTARSIIDILERMNAMLRGGAEEFARIGSTSAANAELLEIIGFEDPELLGSWVSFDRSHLRISLDVGEMPLSTAEPLLEAIDLHISSILPDSWTVEITGESPLSVDWVTDIQSTQRRTFPISLTLVFLLVAVFLRSIPWSLAALVPPTAAAVVCLGAMGATGLTLDVGRAMIAAVLMGIGVDDSIYILSRQRVLSKQGMAARDAFRSAFIESGRPVVISSLALSLGFMTLKASAWGTVSGFGFFLSLSILMALATTLFVVPALAFTILPKAPQPVSGFRSTPGTPVIG
jgi:predicted RND superfamily exporter protein